MNTRQYILDVIFPVTCVSCRNELEYQSSYICPLCAKRVAQSVSGFSCPICESRTPFGIICILCRRKTRLTRFFHIAQYRNDTVRELVFLLKYHRAKIIHHQITAYIHQTLRRHHMDKLFRQYRPTVISVPLSKKRRRFRGFNHAEILAKEIARNFDLEYEPGTLHKIKETAPQSSIEDHPKRKENIRGVFECPHANIVKGKTILLIDDVYTSGATMEECAKTLKESGAKEVWGLVFAKG